MENGIDENKVIDFQINITTDKAWEPRGRHYRGRKESNVPKQREGFRRGGFTPNEIVRMCGREEEGGGVNELPLLRECAWGVDSRKDSGATIVSWSHTHPGSILAIWKYLSGSFMRRNCLVDGFSCNCVVMYLFTYIFFQEVLGRRSSLGGLHPEQSHCVIDKYTVSVCIVHISWIMI